MSRTPHRPVVIVDPWSSGSLLARAFHARDIECVAVKSTVLPPAPVRSTWRPEDFIAVHTLDGDVRALAAAVAEHDPSCVIAGAESGVELADALVDLVVPGTGNVTRTVEARRDKHGMGLALRATGVPHLREVCTHRHADVEAWIRAEGLEDRRLVVKPPKSGGTEDVYIVRPGGDWRPYFDHILGRENVFMFRNEAVIVQEFAAGTEYIVDTYSVDGRHGLVDVCRYAKATRGDHIGVYDRVDFIAPDDAAVAPLFDYTQRVLDAVGVRNGPAHVEVMLTADGPVLIEVGARPAGAEHQDLSLLATGDSHIQRCVAHRVDGTFRPGYELQRSVRAVFLSSPRAGVLRNAEIFDAVDALASCHSTHVWYANGDQVPATVDLITPLGLVILASEDEQQLNADYGAIKNLERELQIESLEYAEA